MSYLFYFFFISHINLFSKTPILQIVCNRHTQRGEYKYRMAQTTIPALPTFSQNYVAVLRIDNSHPIYTILTHGSQLFSYLAHIKQRVNPFIRR